MSSVALGPADTHRLEAGLERDVVLALARIEALRLLRHPVLLAGAVLSVVFALSFAPQAEIGGDYLVLTGPALFPLAVATLIAANLAALRSRRSGTEELNRSLPCAARARTLAMLLAVGAAVALAALLVMSGLLWFGAGDGLVVAPDGRTAVPGLDDLAQGPMAVGACGALGVAMARWIPRPVAALAAVGLFVFQMPFMMWNLQGAGGWLLPLVNPARSTADSSWPCSLDQDWPCIFGELAGLGWHVAYLGGLTLTFAGLALLRDGRSRSHRGVFALGALLTVVAGVVQLP